MPATSTSGFLKRKFPMPQNDGSVGLADSKPEGLWCWGCNRRFVAKGQPTSGPLDSVRWREWLCSDPECPGQIIANGRKR